MGIENSRILNEDLKERIVTAETAASWIGDGMTLGLSGFTRAGDLKAIPDALVKRAETDPFKVNVFTGASLGSDIDRMFAEADIINKRLPFQADPRMRQGINEGSFHFVDQHLSHTSEMLRQGVLPEVDYAILEAVSIKEDGTIIPTTSVGNSLAFAMHAEHIIVEINEAQPGALEGVHDLYAPAPQGQREPIPLVSPEERIGTEGIQVDPAKIKGIIFTNQLDSPSTVTPPDAETRDIAGHLIDFLKEEVRLGKLPENLVPLQSGIGSVANAVFHGLLDSDFEHLQVYSEVLQDSVIDLLDAGKVDFASGCSVTLSEDKMKQVFSNFEDYRDRVVLRPQEISNHPEIIRRLGLISINTAVEMDIYGNVNSTHVGGTKMMNGIGGSGDFARNSRLGIFVTKSIAKDGDISSIVPFVPHVDHTEHDVDVIVTDQGYADLRGLAPRERAGLIIERCAHPSYREQLHDYFEAALERGGQTPHMLEEALAWHREFETNGSMKKLVKS
ncbi:acetyl-CoA hydrolase/transferase family protein [Salimicrobium humidisoli]|uniref:Acetyl-CoA hydrolase n=1 Tax=Salimicrobium humidisoli TaxID=2029857 RepID=A0ABX4HVW7_9BACI|nr:acetyl-CoA hydrolase/transferase family protein [Salimicrobium humidisoli]PBB06626.1 acetyl-CoA hydrolase [Salimicrobium humidisoli]